MTQQFALDEQETTFTVEATDRNTMYIYSNDSVWLGRLERLGVEPERETSYGKSYKIDLREFTFTLRPKRKMSDAEKSALAKRLVMSREAQQSTE